MAHDMDPVFNALMRRFYRGDDGAFDELHTLLKPATHAHIREIIRGIDCFEEIAEELTQDTFLQVWRTRDNPYARWCESRSDVRYWLMRIARNLAASYMRSKKRRALPREWRENYVALRETPDDKYTAFISMIEARDAVESVWETLDAQQQRAVRDFYDKQMSLDEIGRARGVSTPVAFRRLAAARQAIRDALQNGRE